jgi:hypothetical protein
MNLARAPSLTSAKSSGAKAAPRKKSRSRETSRKPAQPKDRARGGKPETEPPKRDQPQKAAASVAVPLVGPQPLAPAASVSPTAPVASQAAAWLGERLNDAGQKAIQAGNEIFDGLLDWSMEEPAQNNLLEKENSSLSSQVDTGKNKRTKKPQKMVLSGSLTKAEVIEQMKSALDLLANERSVGKFPVASQSDMDKLSQALWVMSSARRVDLINPQTKTFHVVGGSAMAAGALGVTRSKIGSQSARSLVQQLGHIAAIYPHSRARDQTPDEAILYYDLSRFYRPNGALNDEAMRKLHAESTWLEPNQYFADASNQNPLKSIIAGLADPEWQKNAGRYRDYTHSMNRAFPVTIKRNPNKAIPVLEGLFLPERLRGDEQLVFILRDIFGLPTTEISKLVNFNNKQVNARGNNAGEWVSLWLTRPANDSAQATVVSNNNPIPPEMAELRQRREKAGQLDEEEAAATLNALMEEGTVFGNREAKEVMAEGTEFLQRLQPEDGRKINPAGLQSAREMVLFFSPDPAPDGTPGEVSRFSFSPEQYVKLTKVAREMSGNPWETAAISYLYEKVRGLGPFMQITDENGEKHFSKVSDVYLNLFRNWKENHKVASDVHLMDEAAGLSRNDAYRERVREMEELLA